MATLFYNTSLAVDQFSRRFGVTVSSEFVDCADAQLTRLLNQQTGLKAGKNLCFSIATPDDKLHYSKGATSKFSISLFVNHHWNPVTITWQSASGRIYNINDTDIDCADIVFSFEHLDIALYHKQMYPNDPVPFKLKDLSFDLVVERINQESCFIFTLRTGNNADPDSIINQINDFIENYNAASEKKGGKYGVIHNYSATVNDAHDILYDIDLGFTGPRFVKKLLEFASDMNIFSKVSIE